MGTLTTDYLEAIERLPEGATLTFYQVGWDEYDRLVEGLAEGPRRRVSYDSGRLEVMTPSSEHEVYARFIDALICVVAEELGLALESFGSTTWKRRRLAKGAEPDSCYYVANAHRIIGKVDIDLESDPPPDIVLEIDITNESLSKFPIYAAFGVREIWRYAGGEAHFYERSGDEYREVSDSPSFAGFTPRMLVETLEHRKRAGQTAALHAFRTRWRESHK